MRAARVTQHGFALVGDMTPSEALAEAKERWGGSAWVQRLEDSRPDVGGCCVGTLQPGNFARVKGRGRTFRAAFDRAREDGR